MILAYGKARHRFRPRIAKPKAVRKRRKYVMVRIDAPKNSYPFWVVHLMEYSRARHRHKSVLNVAHMALRTAIEEFRRACAERADGGAS